MQSASNCDANAQNNVQVVVRVRPLTQTYQAGKSLAASDFYLTHFLNN